MLKHQLKMKRIHQCQQVIHSIKNVPYKKETGYYTVANVKGNNVRDGYSTNSRITGVLPNNATIKYDGAYCINGYRWITYIANSGQRRYIATGEVDKAGNRISSFGKFSAVW